MCLLTNQATSIINEKPIKAYKVLIKIPTLSVIERSMHILNKYISPIMEFNYTHYIHSGRIIRGIIPEAIWGGEVHAGFHLFISLDVAKKLSDPHSKMVIFECEIPSNSHCFVSYDDLEICTNQFRFIRELCV